MRAHLLKELVWLGACCVIAILLQVQQALSPVVSISRYLSLANPEI